MRVAGAYCSFTFILLHRIVCIVPALTYLNLNLTTVKSQIKDILYIVRQKEIIKQVPSFLHRLSIALWQPRVGKRFNLYSCRSENNVTS